MACGSYLPGVFVPQLNFDDAKLIFIKNPEDWCVKIQIFDHLIFFSNNWIYLLQNSNQNSSRRTREFHRHLVFSIKADGFRILEQMSSEFWSQIVDDLTFYAGIDLQRWIYVLQGVFLTTSSLWTQQEPFAKKKWQGCFCRNLHQSFISQVL